MTSGEHSFTIEGLKLTGYLAQPARDGGDWPAIVICHGFPNFARGSAGEGHSYYGMADRIAQDKGWLVLALNCRGCGRSEGNFSMGAWLQDVRAAIDELLAVPQVGGVWLAGFGTGACLAVCAGAADPRVRGVAAVGPRADFDDWAANPRFLLVHARKVGVIDDEDFPESIEDWGAEMAAIRAVDCAADLAPRPLLVVHGAADDVVPVFDARVIADAHGQADLRIIGGAGHGLRYDPRVLAVLLGWLDRQRV